MELLEQQLFAACTNGQLGVVKNLVNQNNINVACRDKDGDTPLQVACYYGHVEIVRYLAVDKKCDVETRNNKGQTPLNYAAAFGHLNIVKLLVDDMQCDPTIRGGFSRTPLHDACETGHLHIVRYLIDEVHVNPLCREDQLGGTPLHLASEFGHTEIVRYLTLKKKIDAECRDNTDNTPLHCAAHGGHLDTVKVLVDECHCDPMCKGEYGRTSLHRACTFGHLSVAMYLIDEQNVDASHRDTNNATPLHLAAKNGHTEVVKYLVGIKKCDPAPRARDGKTPRELARDKGHMDVALYLEGQGGGPNLHLLPTLPSAQVDENRVSPSAFPAPLIVKLPSSTPRHGVFSSLISFLQSDKNGFPCNWNIKRDQSFTPECLFRNCAKFEVPKHPATITLINSTDFIEVHVNMSVSRIAEEFHYKVHLKLCCNIQEALLAGLKKANSSLGYSVAEYSSGLRIAFACRCEGCDVHSAEVEDDTLVCDKGTYSEVQQNHRIWFTAQNPRPTVPDSPTNTASAPTSPPQESDREPLGPTPKASPSTSSQQVPQKTKGTISRFLSSLFGRQQHQEHSDSRETIGEKPRLAQLKLMRTASGKKIEIIKTVATRWRNVGILLDFDPEGDKVAEIEADHSRSGVRACCQEMFRHWLSGGGRPATWATLIEVLEDEEYRHLAGQVRLALGVSD